jgi:hypothetical protein
MAVSLTSPVTGAAQTGFTSPTYTHVADIAPDNNGKQYAVTALGGTQAGVSYHSSSNPFTITISRPRVFKALGKANPTTGVVANVPTNVYKVLVRKGAVPLAGQATALSYVRCEIGIPAGTDLASPAEIRALLSMFIGSVTQISSGLGDTATSGIV